MVIIIATADFVTPAQVDLCVLQLVLLPLMWRLLHRRYIPHVTAMMMLATILPGLFRAIHATIAVTDSSDPSGDFAPQLSRGLTVLALFTASIFHTNMQQSRRRRLALRRELQQRVRQRNTQLQRVNLALRSEIARREETQHLLTRSETNFQVLIDRMQLQVLRKDTDGVITYANETFCQQVGRTTAEVVGCTDDDLYPESLASIYRADDARVMATGQSVEHVEQHPAADGEAGFVQVFKAPEYDQAGQCTGIQVIFWDVTQKHRAEIALRNSEARKRALFEAAGDAVLLVDDQYRIVEANPSATVLFNRSVSELVHRFLPDIAIPLSSPTSTTDDEFSSSNERHVRGHVGWGSLPRSQRCELTIVRSDGVRFDSEVSLHPVPIGASAGIAIIVRDVTLRRQAFEALREGKAAAEAASRTKTEFMAGVSHELRTPLGGIMGLSDLLLSTPLSAKARQYVDMIRHSATLLGEVIEDILDFAALEAGRVQIHLEPVDLHAVIGDAFKTLAARAIGKPLHLIFSIDAATPRHVIADSKRLRQIVINLAGNAIKFTPSGIVHVRLSVLAPPSPWTQPTSTSRPSTRVQTIVLDVIDTGVGIAADKHHTVFDAFERGEASTTQRFGGTGLGLSISDGLVRRFGGKIELESEVNVGSRFRCLLPLEVATSESAAQKVLIPDDALVSVQDPTVRLAITEMLLGLHVNAHSRLPKRKPTSRRPLIWVLDVTSPFIKELRQKRRPQDTVIWLTRLGQGVPHEARSIDPVLVEPVLPSELFQVLVSEQITLDSPASSPDEIESNVPVDGYRVLVVDDSEVNRVLLNDQLSSAGYHVDLACDGNEACSKAIERYYDCILMDLQMPDMDGTDATRAIQSHYQSKGEAKPPVIALTAHATDQHRKLCLDAGMDGFLTKPVDRTKLLKAISELIDVEARPLPSIDPTAQDSTIEPPTWQRRLSDLAGDDPQTIAAICDAFLEEVPQLVARLRESVETADSRSAARAAHTLKSCLKHVADDDDVALIHELEKRATGGLPLTKSHVDHAESIAQMWIEKVSQINVAKLPLPESSLTRGEA